MCLLQCLLKSRVCCLVSLAWGQVNTGNHSILFCDVHKDGNKHINATCTISVVQACKSGRQIYLIARYYRNSCWSHISQPNSTMDKCGIHAEWKAITRGAVAKNAKWTGSNAVYETRDLRTSYKRSAPSTMSGWPRSDRGLFQSICFSWVFCRQPCQYGIWIETYYADLELC